MTCARNGTPDRWGACAGEPELAAVFVLVGETRP